MGTHPIFESDFDCLTERELQMADSEENFEVEEIVNHRFRKGKIQYLIRWKNYTPEDDTWEPKENLECPEKIEAYNKKAKVAEELNGQKKSLKRKNSVGGDSPMDTSGLKKEDKANQLALPNTQTDFSRFFTTKYEAERIVGATDEYGELHFLIKWKNKKEADLIPSKIANVKIPQMVIAFYEQRLSWGGDKI